MVEQRYVLYMDDAMIDEPIPQLWIKDYVDSLLLLAAKLHEGSMRDATMLRAEHAMDLVEAFKSRNRDNDSKLGHQHDEAVNKLLKELKR